MRKKYLIIGGVIILILAAAGIILTLTPSSKPASAPVSRIKPSDILNNPSAYKDKKVSLVGTIVQMPDKTYYLLDAGNPSGTLITLDFSNSSVKPEQYVDGTTNATSPYRNSATLAPSSTDSAPGKPTTPKAGPSQKTYTPQLLEVTGVIRQVNPSQSPQLKVTSVKNY